MSLAVIIGERTSSAGAAAAEVSGALQEAVGFTQLSEQLRRGLLGLLDLAVECVEYGLGRDLDAC